MAITRTYASSAAGRVFRHPHWELKGSDLHQAVLSIQATPSWFLPVIAKRRDKELPYVMYPGTIVGKLNARDHSGLDAAFLAQKNSEQVRNTSVIVPACGSAYTLTYGSNDLSTDEYGGVYDIDVAGGETIVAATGASSTSIAVVRPLGIVQEPIISQAYYRRSINFQQQPMVNLLSRGQILRIPVITSEEQSIYPGDKVMVTDTPSTYNPLGSPTTPQPGRYKIWDETPADVNTIGASLPLIVGTCVGRHKIAAQSAASAGSMLLDDVFADLVDKSSLNEDEGYNTLARVQTVPSVVGLQGSGTGGVPSALTFARADSSGYYWAIDIAFAVLGV